MNWMQEPKVEGELSSAAVRFHKLLWEAQVSPGARRVVPRLWPTSLCFFDQHKYPAVIGHDALTFDDAFCRPGHEENAMVKDVQDLLKKHGATATFFTIGEYCSDKLDNDILSLLKDGHELSNHCHTDRRHDDDSTQAFADSLDQADQELIRLQGSTNQWFRAPHGKLSNTMDDVLASRGMQNVMFDSYGNDTQIPDGKYIADVMLRLIDHGSIGLIHMPERNFREWNFTALKLFLEGLDRKGLRAVNLTQLAKLARFPIVPAGPRS